MIYKIDTPEKKAIVENFNMNGQFIVLIFNFKNEIGDFIYHTNNPEFKPLFDILGEPTNFIENDNEKDLI